MIVRPKNRFLAALFDGTLKSLSDVFPAFNFIVDDQSGCARCLAWPVGSIAPGSYVVLYRTIDKDSLKVLSKDEFNEFFTVVE